jgi:hypothetical protein
VLGGFPIALLGLLLDSNSPHCRFVLQFRKSLAYRKAFPVVEFGSIVCRNIWGYFTAIS